jgi:glycosyltransferase involved in cell wall biosynthesis
METMPLVSVLMPVRNEAAFIERSVRAVLNQDYPQNKIEIIVTDGMSADGTKQKLMSLQKEYANLCVIDNPLKIVAAGLNRALRIAKGGILIRVDGHAEIAPDYVRRCVDRLNGGEADVVGGIIHTVGEGIVAKAIAAAMSSAFGVGGTAFRTGVKAAALADTVPFPAYRREVFEKAGDFDEELVRNQDDEHNYRLRKLGFKVLLDPAISSRYYSRTSLVSLAKQYFQYGFWKVRILQKHPRQMQWRQFVPPAFVVGFVLGFPFVSLIYGALNLLMSAKEAAGSNFRFIFILPAVFFILHFSYGLGFLAGLTRFWNRWGHG